MSIFLRRNFVGYVEHKNGFSSLLVQIILTKETTLERADFTLQLLLFVNRGKVEKNVFGFLSFQILSAFVPTILS